MTISFTAKNKTNVLSALEGGKFYKQLSSAEWHQFVLHYNFDDGMEPFFWLARQKVCDKGTALLLYWMLHPDFYHTNEDSRDSEDYALIKEIEERFCSGFYESEIFFFDPHEEWIGGDTDLSGIPEMMRRRTEGVSFGSLELETVFLRPLTEQEEKSILKKIADAVKIIRMFQPDFERGKPEQTVKTIAKSVGYWKKNESGKIKVQHLAWLWLDALHEKYGWGWETGCALGVHSKTARIACLTDIFVRHVLDDLLPLSSMEKLFKELGKAEKEDLDLSLYMGLGVVKFTDHLPLRDKA